MTIVRFDPFREMAALQDRVNRMFADAYGRRDDDDLTTADRGCRPWTSTRPTSTSWC